MKCEAIAYIWNMPKSGWPIIFYTDGKTWPVTPVRRWYLRLSIKSMDSLILSHQAFALIDKAKKYSNIQDVVVCPKNVRTMLDFRNLDG